MAITGGVNCILDPSIFISLSTARMASPTGKCHTFSENADGYVRGEGCGIVILKTLRDVMNRNFNLIFLFYVSSKPLANNIMVYVENVKYVERYVIPFQALRDKNKIWGTIFTGLNQDGHTVSPITSPSGKQQEQLLENVFEKYKIQPSNVQYIEAHGKILNLNLKTHTSYQIFIDVNIPYMDL